MTTTATPTSTPVPAVRPHRLLLRWSVSFVGFPLGGLLAWLALGPVDGPVPALVGGLVTGLVTGAVQAWALRLDRRRAPGWALATASGLGLGLLAGATLVGYATSLGALAVQGAVCGVAVGTAQAVALRPRLGALALLWPASLGLAWAAGWVVTTLVGVRVEDRYTVFGSSGALVVTLLTTVLPLVLARRGARSAS